MKNLIKVLGVLGVFSLICGCSDSESNHPLKPASEEAVEDSSSSTKDKEAKSSSSKGETKAKSSSSKGSKEGKDSKDTVEVHEQVIMTDSGAIANITYPSSAVCFCWTEGCEKDFSSSSAAPASSETISITVSSESSEPPEVNGDRMTDKRDNKNYKLQNVGSKLWMAENLKFETSGSFCSTEGGEDHCAKYGRYYTYAAAKRACPSGWRLPTESEVLEADGIVDHKWWSVGGRFKVSNGKATDFGLENEQGYIWTETNGENNSWRVKNYDGDEEHAMQSSDGAERAYNVRCVQE